MQSRFVTNVDNQLQITRIVLPVNHCVSSGSPRNVINFRMHSGFAISEPSADRFELRYRSGSPHTYSGR